MIRYKKSGITRRNFIGGSAGAVIATYVMRTGLAKGSENVPKSSAIIVWETDKGKDISKGVWVVEKSTELRSLNIGEGASLAAPEGKSLAMTVDGIGTAMNPGIYTGKIVMTIV